jgi:MYXO-CTERM domain-containing protein
MKTLIRTLSGVALALTLGSTQPMAQLVFNNGDLMLGFRTAGGADDLQVNLGDRANYLRQDGVPFGLGNFSADLAGASLSLNNLKLSVSGTVRPGDGAAYPDMTLWVTRARSTPGIQSTPWNRNSESTLGNTASKIRAIGLNAVSYSTSVGSTDASKIVVPDSSTLSYKAQVGTGGNFGGYPGVVEGTTSASFSSGVTPLRLDLYEIQPGSGPSTFMGYFEMTPSGDMSFSPVPEPEAFGAMAGAGLLGFALWRRRNRRQTAVSTTT